MFSPDRVYRYTLLHSWRGLLDTEDRIACWIALNPSTADENQLDPTLRRIRGYSMRWGYYQQMRAFFTKKTDAEPSADNN